MSYVVYEKATTRYAGKKAKYNDPIFSTLAAAKSHLTRLVNKGKYEESELDISELTFFRDNVEKVVERVNIMSGTKFVERINTPYYCSPSSETYWSM